MPGRLLVRSFLLATLLGAASSACAGASCLLFPLSCLAPSHKYGDEVEATVLGIDKTFTEVYVTTFYTDHTTVNVPHPLDNTREYYVSYQVGQTRYVAWKKDTVVQMAGMLGGYTPKREKWVGKQVKLRFMDEDWMGLKTPVAAFKTPEGKEWKLVIVSIVGPDGVDECPPAFGLAVNLGHCKPQHDIDRPQREAEILAKLKADGKGPVWESAEGAALAASVRSKSETGAAVAHGQAAAAALVPAFPPNPATTNAEAPASTSGTATTAGIPASASATVTSPEVPASASGTATSPEAPTNASGAAGAPEGTTPTDVSVSAPAAATK